MKKEDLLRRLPAVDAVLQDRATETLLAVYGQGAVTRALRALLATWREKILEGGWQSEDLDLARGELPQTLANLLENDSEPNLRPVINATGIIIHTNLGRSLLADQAMQQIGQVAGSYSTLEVDYESGRRGLRYEHVVDLLKELTGAEAALVVNNNAAAVLLTLTALTAGRQVLVSRGQLVEIGGSFRIPDVMRQSGSELVEVGTTNKTHLFDYETAIGSETAALLKVHTSNYRLIGFTEEVSGPALASLAHDRGLLALEDLGSGVFIDLAKYGLPAEPTVQSSVASGMDVVTFSGDKLLGGPQAGIIVGRSEVIKRLGKHPLTRALRIDKLTLAALEATLRLYLDEKQALAQIPTLRMLTVPVEELEKRAAWLKDSLPPAAAEIAKISQAPSQAQVGGGSLPGFDIPSVALTIAPLVISLTELEERLRRGRPSVFTRVFREQLWLDLRTVQEPELPMLGQALGQALLGEVAR